MSAGDKCAQRVGLGEACNLPRKDHPLTSGKHPFGLCHAFTAPAPQPPALCAKVVDGEVCATPADEPPHGKMSGHRFVAPDPMCAGCKDCAPQPPADAAASCTFRFADGEHCELPAGHAQAPCSRPAGSPVTGDGSPKLTDYAEAYAAGLARGRALGARDEREALLRLDQPWSLPEVLKRLNDATKHLLSDHGCDTHGHEGIRYAQQAAEEMLTEIARRAGRTP